MHGEKLIDALNNTQYHSKARQMLIWFRVFSDIDGVFYEKHVLGMEFKLLIQRNKKYEVSVYVSFLPNNNAYKTKYSTTVLRHYSQIFDINGPERMCYHRDSAWFDIYDYLGEYEDV